MTDITAGTLADFHYDYTADENNIWINLRCQEPNIVDGCGEDNLYLWKGGLSAENRVLVYQRWISPISA
jgi:hypothetical protein